MSGAGLPRVTSSPPTSWWKRGSSPCWPACLRARRGASRSRRPCESRGLRATRAVRGLPSSARGPRARRSRRRSRATGAAARRSDTALRTASRTIAEQSAKLRPTIGVRHRQVEFDAQFRARRLATRVRASGSVSSISPSMSKMTASGRRSGRGADASPEGDSRTARAGASGHCGSQRSRPRRTR